MLERLGRREKFLIVLTLVLILGGSYYFLLIKPLRAEGERLGRELIEVENTQILARGRIAQIPELERELEELAAEKERLLRYPIYDPEDILVDLIAIVEGAELIATAYQPTINNQEFTQQFRLRGSYYSMVSLITILEDLDPRLEVVRFDINPRDDELEMILTVKYYLVDEGEG